MGARPPPPKLLLDAAARWPEIHKEITMIRTSSLLRSAAVASTVFALGAGPAAARQSDVPLRPATPVTSTTPKTNGIPARVDGMGVQPPRPQQTSPAAASPLVVQNTGSGLDWLSAAIGAMALLALGLAAYLLRSVRHPFHHGAA
jgi:hypothetical protein